MPGLTRPYQQIFVKCAKKSEGDAALQEFFNKYKNINEDDWNRKYTNALTKAICNYFNKKIIIARMQKKFISYYQKN